MFTGTGLRPTNPTQLTLSVVLLTTTDPRSALVAPAQLEAIAALLKLERAGVRA